MTKPKAGKDPRAAAARCLAAVADGQSLSRQLPLDEQRLPPEQRPLYRELCYGTLRHYFQLQGLLRPLLQKGFKPKDRDLFMLLCLGLYQLDHLRIPAHAALNNTVNATDALGKPWAKGLVNAVLRRYQREGESLRAALGEAAMAAHPDWLLAALKEAWPEQAAAIVEANNGHPPLCLRVNRRRGTRDDYLAQLVDADIAASPCAYAEDGLRLAQPLPVDRLPGFADGLVSVQDESAQLAAQLLDLAPRQRVLDACAAPGGKTCHLLEREPELAEVVAIDVDEARLGRVRDNLQRLQLDATLVAGDAAQPDSWWDGVPFDRILLDAPCSATGVLRRNPDIKLHRRGGDIAALATLQGQLLDALWPLLKPGGVLLYATCSLLPQENREVVSAFLARQGDAAELAIDADWGLVQSAGRQLLPQSGGADGFYYARLIKGVID